MHRAEGRRLMSGALSAAALALCLDARESGAERIWTTLVSEARDYEARNIDKGTPMGFPNGPDARTRREFQIPSKGLLRVTKWVHPYYPMSQRDPNTGGAGLVRKGDDSMLGYPPLWERSRPAEPVAGISHMRSFVGEVDPHPAAWIELTPPVAASGWAQQRGAIRALVEFSPEPARAGEAFEEPTQMPGAPQPPQPPPTRPDGRWSVKANGYEATLEVSSQGSRLTGRLFYKVAQKWETLTDVTYDPAIQEIAFTRPWAGNPKFQRYRGRILGARVTGTFTDTNAPGRQFDWNGTRE